MTRPRTGPADDAEARARDLRDALGDIVGALHLVDGAVLGEAAQRQLGRALAASRAALRLVEAGGATGPTDLIGLLRDLEDRWGGRAAALDSALAVSVAPDVPRWLPVDQLTLERALSHLLALALAGVRGGSVRLAVDRGAEALVFSVGDDGEDGAGRAGPRPDPAEAAALAEALGGDLVLETRPSDGFGARLALPRAVWDGPGSEVRDDGDLSGMVVGLVGLPEAEAATIAGIVAERGGRTQTLAMDETPPSPACTALVLDADAPGAADLLAAGPDGPVAVVAVTGAILAVHRAGLADAGADALLARPLPAPDIVARTLRAAVETRRAAADIAEPGPLDPARLERLLDLAGPEVAGELLDRLIDDLGTAARGIAAAAPARDGSGLRSHTHVLISLAGAVGADRLQRLAEALNLAAHATDVPAIDRLGAEAGEELARLVALIEDLRRQRRAAS